MIFAYDSQFYQQLGTITDSKTYSLFSINESQNSLIAVNKKKLSIHSWQSPGFNLRKEYTLIDIPKNICYVKNCAIIGYKKFYECFDLVTSVATRILDVERDHRMVILEVTLFYNNNNIFIFFNHILLLLINCILYYIILMIIIYIIFIFSYQPIIFDQNVFYYH